MGLHSSSIRTKPRTIEELLFDLDSPLPHQGFIQRAIDEINTTIESGGMTRKEVDSIIPDKFSESIPEIYKEYHKSQNEFTARHGTLFFQEILAPRVIKDMAKMSKKEVEENLLKMKQTLESEKKFPPDQIKTILKLARTMADHAKQNLSTN